MAVEELALSTSAAQLRESLELCQNVTAEASQLLDLCSQHLRDLDRTVQPMTVRTLALTRARDNLKKARERAEEVLEHLDASRKVQGVVQEGPRANLQAFLAALGKLEGAIEFLQQHRHMHTATDALAHTTALRDRSMEACGAEFAALLAKHSAVPPALLALQRQATTTASLALASQDLDQDLSSLIVDLLPEGVLSKLRALAQAQLRNGSRSCVKGYVEARRRVMQQCLEGLLAAVGSREDIARLASWRQVEVKIPGWVAAVKLLVRLVQEEARLCAAVFPPPEQPPVLQQVTAAAGRAVVEAGDAILSGRRVPDKLFGLLDMHDVVAWGLPPLRGALAAQHASRLERTSPGPGGAPPPAPAPLPVVGELSALQGRVVAEVRACFAQLQESYGGRVPEGVPADATVHPMCGSTVAALKRLVSYESALPVLFGEGDGGGGGSGAAAAAGRGGLQEEARLLERMSAAVTAILDSLMGALDAKAQASYRGRAQAALHMLNNAQFVAHAAAGRELKAVGEAWLEAHRGLAERYQQQYMEACWAPLVSLLQADLRQPAPSPAQLEKGGRQAAKDKWAAVNKLLEPVLAQQGSWTVVDSGLRFGLKDSIAELVLPLYQGFTERYMRLPFTENRSKYIRFGVSQLQNFLAHELFEKGDAASGGASGRTASPQVTRSSMSGSGSVGNTTAAAREASAIRQPTRSG